MPFFFPKRARATEKLAAIPTSTPMSRRRFVPSRWLRGTRSYSVFEASKRTGVAGGRSRNAKKPLNFADHARDPGSIWLALNGGVLSSHYRSGESLIRLGGCMEVTHEDATIFMDLVRWSGEIGLSTALSEIYADGFDPTDESINNESVRKVLMFGETAGALVKHNVLPWELLSDLFWFEGMWSKVGSHALLIRERHGDPRLYEHFEALAARGAN